MTTPDPVREALIELVALKKLKDSLELWVRNDATGEQRPAMQPMAARDAAAAEYSRRKPLAWAAAEAALSAPPPQVPEDEVMEMWYCEPTKVVLRAGQLYRFKFDPTCESCMAGKKEHDGAYTWLASPPPNTPREE